MKYYKDINGNIYCGDKADYRDTEMSQSEIDAYNTEREAEAIISKAKSDLMALDLRRIRPVAELLNPDVSQKDKDDALIMLKAIELDVKEARKKIK